MRYCGPPYLREGIWDEWQLTHNQWTKRRGKKKHLACWSTFLFVVLTRHIWQSVFKNIFAIWFSFSSSINISLLIQHRRTPHSFIARHYWDSIPCNVVKIIQNWRQEINLLLFFAFNCSIHTKVWKSDKSFCFFSLQQKKKRGKSTHQPIGKLPDSNVQQYLTCKCFFWELFILWKYMLITMGTDHIQCFGWYLGTRNIPIPATVVQILGARKPPLLSLQLAVGEHGICCTLLDIKVAARGRILSSYNSAEVDSLSSPWSICIGAPLSKIPE